MFTLWEFACNFGTVTPSVCIFIFISQVKQRVAMLMPHRCAERVAAFIL